MAKMQIEIENDMNATQMVDVYSKDVTAAYVAAEELSQIIDDAKAGAQNCAINVKLGVVQAAVNGTFTGAPTAAETMVINGVTFTAIANASTPTNNQFRIGTTAATAAANLVAAINASTTANISNVVYASNLLGVVTFTCKVGGNVGNAVTLSESLSNFTLAATVMSGGTTSTNKTYQFGKAPTTTY